MPPYLVSLGIKLLGMNLKKAAAAAATQHFFPNKRSSVKFTKYKLPRCHPRHSDFFSVGHQGSSFLFVSSLRSFFCIHSLIWQCFFGEAKKRHNHNHSSFVMKKWQTFLNHIKKPFSEQGSLNLAVNKFTMHICFPMAVPPWYDSQAWSLSTKPKLNWPAGTAESHEGHT